MGIVDDHTRKQHLGHGYTLHATLMRPKSRGTVRLASTDPAAAPLVVPARLTTCIQRGLGRADRLGNLVAIGMPRAASAACGSRSSARSMKARTFGDR